MKGAALHPQPRAAPDGVAEGIQQVRAGGVVRLRRRGTLTAATAAGVRELLRECVGMGSSQLLVDLEAVESIDAAGIAALLDGRRLMEAAAGVLFLRVGPMVDRALGQTGTASACRAWPDAGT